MEAGLFEKYRSRLFGIAYRMLGTVSEAEDVVQDTYLRWHQLQDQQAVANVEAFLVTVTTRLCIDYLKSAKAQRDCYVGPWLPEPLVSDTRSGPEAQKELADTLSYAFMMLLERLNPLERAVYILREAFDLRHEEIAGVLGRNSAHSRQLSRRAKAQLGKEAKRFKTTETEKEKLFTRFVEAAAQGDLQPLIDMLADDVTVYSDGGGKALAALRPLQGKERILRFLGRVFPQQDPSGEIQFCRVNGQPAILISLLGEATGVITFHFVESKIQQIFVVKNPDKLSHTEARYRIA